MTIDAKAGNASDVIGGVSYSGSSGGTSGTFGTAASSNEISLNGSTTGGLLASNPNNVAPNGTPFGYTTSVFIARTLLERTGAYRRYGAWINRVAGVVMIVIGLLLATGQLTRITQALSGYGLVV